MAKNGEIMERFEEAKGAFLEAARPFHDLMSEVLKRMPEDAQVIENNPVHLRLDLLVDTTSEDPGSSEEDWLEFVDPKGIPVFRLPEDEWDKKVVVRTRYGQDKRFPLAVDFTLEYSEHGIDNEVEVRLLWVPEKGRFELLDAAAYFPDLDIEEEPYIPWWIYDNFLR